MVSENFNNLIQKVSSLTQLSPCHKIEALIDKNTDTVEAKQFDSFIFSLSIKCNKRLCQTTQSLQFAIIKQLLTQL